MNVHIAKVEESIDKEADFARKTILTSLKYTLEALYVHDNKKFVEQFEELVEQQEQIISYILEVFEQTNNSENPMQRYAAALAPLKATSVGCFSYELSPDLKSVVATCWDGEKPRTGPIGVDGYCLFGFALSGIYKVEILRKEWVGSCFEDNIQSILLGERPISEVAAQYAQMRELLLRDGTRQRLQAIFEQFEEHPAIVFMQGVYNLLGSTRELRTMAHCFEVISEAYARYFELKRLQQEVEANVTIRDVFQAQNSIFQVLQSIERRLQK